jgi:hypothetical protein
LSVMAVLYHWRRRTKVSSVPAEPVLSAIRAAICYVRTKRGACPYRDIRFVRERPLGVAAGTGPARDGPEFHRLRNSIRLLGCRCGGESHSLAGVASSMFD